MNVCEVAVFHALKLNTSFFRKMQNSKFQYISLFDLTGFFHVVNMFFPSIFLELPTICHSGFPFFSCTMVVLSRQDTGVPCPDFVEEPRRKYGVDELSGGMYHLTNHNKNGGCLKIADTFLVGGLEHGFYDFPYIGNNHPNWRTHIFQRGRYTTNQIWIYILFMGNWMIVVV